jgi:hypothetical protein
MSGVRRGLSVALGFVALISGAVLALPGVPGPGIPLLLFGLWLLRDHFQWAGRWFSWLQRKTARFRPAHRTKERG